MSTNENAAPPVQAKLYEHQIAAYLFVLHLFVVLDNGTASQGGDANERFHG